MKRILPYLKPYRGKMLLGMLLIAVSSVCSLLLPTIMSDILDGGIYTSDWDYILRCCGRMLLVTLLSLGAVAAGTWCRTQVVSGFCADLRAAVFGRVNALTFEEVSRIGTSALLTRSTHDVGTLAWVADMLSSNIITIPVLFFGGVVLAFSKDSTLALIILVAMPSLRCWCWLLAAGWSHCGKSATNSAISRTTWCGSACTASASSGPLTGRSRNRAA